jgi:hypothetical protein
MCDYVVFFTNNLFGLFEWSFWLLIVDHLINQISTNLFFWIITQNNNCVGKSR